MVKKELVDWIKSQEGKGYTDQQLTEFLAKQGYSEAEAKEAIASTKPSEISSSQKSTGAVKQSTAGMGNTTMYLIAGIVFVVILSTFFFINSMMQIGKLQGEIEDLSSAKSDIRKLQNDISRFESDADDIESLISTVEGQITKVQGDILKVDKILKNNSVSSDVECTDCVTEEEIEFSLADAYSDGGCTDCIGFSDIKDSDSLDSDFEVDIGDNDFSVGEILYVKGSATSSSSSNNSNTTTTESRVGIGTDSPKTILDVDGAIKLGDSEDNITGSIRWDGTDFYGYNGESWVSLSGGAVASSSSVFSCPSGFLIVEEIGCIQTHEENEINSGISEVGWHEAVRTCYNTYKARLPTTLEWYLGMRTGNFDHTATDAESDDFEWNMDATGIDTHATSGNVNIETNNEDSDTNVHAFRCFIPKS